jgi:heme exporter protein D
MNVGDETQDMLDRSSGVLTVETKRKRLNNLFNINVEKARRQFERLMNVFLRNGKWWAIGCVIFFVAVIIGEAGLRFDVGNEPFNLGYGLDVYLYFNWLPIVFSALSVAFLLFTSTQSYKVRGLIIVALITLALEMFIMLLSFIKIGITVFRCIPLVGVPTNVLTNFWIDSVSTALCGGSRGVIFVWSAFTMVLIFVLQILWGLCLVFMLIATGRMKQTMEKMRQTDEHEEAMVACKSCKFTHDSDDGVNLRYDLAHDKIIHHSGMDHYVAGMNARDFSRHVGEKYYDDEIDGSTVKDVKYGKPVINTNSVPEYYDDEV